MFATNYTGTWYCWRVLRMSPLDLGHMAPNSANIKHPQIPIGYPSTFKSFFSHRAFAKLCTYNFQRFPIRHTQMDITCARYFSFVIHRIDRFNIRVLLSGSSGCPSGYFMTSCVSHKHLFNLSPSKRTKFFSLSIIYLLQLNLAFFL